MLKLATTNHLPVPVTAAEQALQPAGLTPQESLFQTIDSLHRLPHLAIGNRDLTYPEGPVTTQVVESGSFPMNRIVGVASFDSWAGRGMDSKGKARSKDAFSSAGTIHYYSQNEPPEGYIPTVTVFKDTRGEVWGATITDGSHRTAAAKLRGDTELSCKLNTNDYDQLPTVNFDVAEEIVKQTKKLNGFIGRVLLRGEVKHLAASSERTEQAAIEKRKQGYN